MNDSDAALEQLASGHEWQPNWADVVERAGHRSAARVIVTRRRLIFALAVLAVVIIPLTAVAAANDWWFFRTSGAPTPTSAPVVVGTGIWDGHPWQLVAYPSTTDGLCVAIMPKTENPSSYGAAMGCGPVAGVAETPQTKPGTMHITYLVGGATSVLPAYIVGPVIEQAVTVAVRFADGTTIRTPTFAGPEPLNHVRFYALQLPKAEVPSTTHGKPPVPPVRWVAGFDANASIVACLAPETATEGTSPLSACR